MAFLFAEVTHEGKVEQVSRGGKQIFVRELTIGGEPLVLWTN